jgi:hypothetical protein
MRVRKGTTIEGEDAYFDHFFCALRDELVGAPPAETAVSSATTAATTVAPPAKPAPRPAKKPVAEADSEEVKRLKDLLAIHKKNLYRLQEKAAMYGIDIPVYVANQIDHEQGEINRIKRQLKELGA